MSPPSLHTNPNLALGPVRRTVYLNCPLLAWQFGKFFPSKVLDMRIPTNTFTLQRSRRHLLHTYVNKHAL